MPERLPRPARPVNTVETSRDLIEENLRLLAATGENALEIDLVAAMFGEFLRATDGKLDEFARDGVGLGIEFVERPFAFAPRFHERAVCEQAEVRRDARLAEPRDFLKFVDRKFVFLQQCNDAQPRLDGQRPQGF